MKINIFKRICIVTMLVCQFLISDEPARDINTPIGSGAMNFGVKLGLNLASMTGNNIGDMSIKPGFAIGIFAERFFLPNVSVQPELIYSVRGAKERYTEEFFGETYTDTYIMTISYFEIPIPVKLHFALPGSPITPHIYAGPAFNIKLGGSVKSEYDDGEYGSETYESDLPDLKPLDVGLQVGAGMRYHSPFGMNSLIKGLIFNLHYERGLGKIKDVDYNWDAKNTNITLRVGAVL